MSDKEYEFLSEIKEDNEIKVKLRLYKKSKPSFFLSLFQQLNCILPFGSLINYNKQIEQYMII